MKIENVNITEEQAIQIARICGLKTDNERNLQYTGRDIANKLISNRKTYHFPPLEIYYVFEYLKSIGVKIPEL